MNLPEIWAVEYSSHQNKFHIEKLEALIKNNKESFSKGEHLQWVIVGIAKTSEKAAQITEELDAILKKRKPCD